MAPEQVGYRAILRNRYASASVLLGATPLIAIGAFTSLMAAYMTDLGASTTFIGVSLTLALIPLAVLPPLGGRLADRRRPLTVGILALAATVPIVFAYGLVASPVSLVFLAIGHTTAGAFLAPAAQTAVVRWSPAGLVASGQGLMEAGGLALAAVGAMGSAALFDAFGPEAAWGGTAVATGALGLVVGTMARGRPKSATSSSTM